MDNELALSKLLTTLKAWGITLSSELAATALTHSSYAYEHDTDSNERLEFLGDAVLELIVSESLFGTYPTESEGELTRRRSKLVCEPSLARCAQALDLGPALRLGRGEEAQGGRGRPALLADTVEALLGAVYLTGGLAASRLLVEHLLAPYFSGQLEPEADYKTTLQEKLQANGHGDIKYQLLKSEGPDHARQFTVGVFVDSTLRAKGTGTSKKEAEQAAAGELLQKLSK